MDKEFYELMKEINTNLWRIGDRMAYADSCESRGVTVSEAIIMSGNTVAKAINDLTDKLDEVADRIDWVSDNLDMVSDNLDVVGDKLDVVGDKLDETNKVVCCL